MVVVSCSRAVDFCEQYSFSRLHPKLSEWATELAFWPCAGDGLVRMLAAFGGFIMG